MSTEVSVLMCVCVCGRVKLCAHKHSVRVCVGKGGSVLQCGQVKRVGGVAGWPQQLRQEGVHRSVCVVVFGQHVYKHNMRGERECEYKQLCESVSIWRGTRAVDVSFRGLGVWPAGVWPAEPTTQQLTCLC